MFHFFLSTECYSFNYTIYYNLGDEDSILVTLSDSGNLTVIASGFVCSRIFVVLVCCCFFRLCLILHFSSTLLIFGRVGMTANRTLLIQYTYELLSGPTFI